MAKRIFLTYGLIIAVLVLIVPLSAQTPDTCDFMISLDSAVYELDDSLVALNISFTGDCYAGGMQYKISTSPEGVIIPFDIDFTGTIIEGWEVLRSNQSPDSTELKFLGIVNMPGGDDPEPLAPGEGHIGTLLCKYRCSFEEGLEVTVRIDSALVPDVTGYKIFPADNTNGLIVMGEDTSIRGDANCDGMLIGADVSYLVNYFRAMLPCPCTLKAGDVNNDGMIIGSDITYLVNYFRGINPPPDD